MPEKKQTLQEAERAWREDYIPVPKELRDPPKKAKK